VRFWRGAAGAARFRRLGRTGRRSCFSRSLIASLRATAKRPATQSRKKALTSAVEIQISAVHAAFRKQSSSHFLSSPLSFITQYASLTCVSSVGSCLGGTVAAAKAQAGVPHASPADITTAALPEAGSRATAAATLLGTLKKMCRCEISDAANRSATVAMSFVFFTNERSVLVLTTTSLRNAVNSPRRPVSPLMCAVAMSASLRVALSEEEPVPCPTEPSGEGACCG